MSKQTIAIDFDGVIHKYSKGWQDGSCYDEPMPGAFDFIARMRSRGFNVVVFTARTNIGEVGQWFLNNWPRQAPYGDVPEVTNQKPIAVAYIDDRAIRFNGSFDSVLLQLRDYGILK